MNLLAEVGAALFDTVAKTDKYPLVKETAEHYRRGDGTPLEILKNTKFIRKAVEKNQNRLLNSLLSGNTLYKKLPNGSLQKTTLPELKDHDRVILQDYFDSDHDADNTIKEDINTGLSIGSFKLQSRSNLEFSKSGQKLLPYGHITHTINDTYDFNKRSVYRIITDPMERSHKAKPYPVSSKWITRPTGVIHIKDEKLDTSQIEWN